MERPFAEWRITYFDLYRGKVFPGIWIVKDTGYVYLFSPTDTGDSQYAPTFLTRFPEAALDAKPEQIKLDYLARDDSWKPVGPTGIDFADAKRSDGRSFRRRQRLVRGAKQTVGRRRPRPGIPIQSGGHSDRAGSIWPMVAANGYLPYARSRSQIAGLG